ncbi:hypothetical protein [Deinococcus hopiensis]|uniref:hypothetical protein n=1 Tax=Deinococcus hopiensis TaxID=309885 RepID=UPI00148285F5|nr:hypothetical protein [Deinococcus hopiensis]
MRPAHEHIWPILDRADDGAPRFGAGGLTRAEEHRTAALKRVHIYAHRPAPTRSVTE